MEANKNLEYVKQTEPASAWLGGKSKIAPVLVEMINSVEHSCYAEPFMGMGGVFFRRNMRPKSEVINDYNKEVANFFRILQRHYVMFMQMMQWTITTRAEFDRLKKADPTTLTDLERAAKFIYMQKIAFGGKCTGQSFGVTTDGPARFDFTKLQPALEDLHTRLSSVVIECLNYSDFIERYDRPHTLFYLDPPYYDCENDYGKDMFAKSDFENLAIMLSNIKGKFILSLNDCPPVREIFKDFDTFDLETTYSVSSQGNQKVREVIIHNLPESMTKFQKELF